METIHLCDPVRILNVRCKKHRGRIPDRFLMKLTYNNYIAFLII